MPHCDYQLVAVGICPECGQAAAQESLRSRPRFALVRRWGKHAVYFALVAGILFGAWRGYQSDFWLRRFSVERLASWSATYPRAQNELDRRYAAGELSLADLQLVVRERFEMNANIIEPRPRDLPLLVRFTPGRGILDAWCQARIRMTKLEIDGEVRTPLPKRSTFVFNLKGHTDMNNPEVYPLIFNDTEPLPVGAHSVEANFEIEMCFGQRQRVFDKELSNLSGSFTMVKSVRREFVVIDKTVAELMVPPVTDEEIRQLVARARVFVGVDREGKSISIIRRGFKLPLIGRFEIFSIGDDSPLVIIEERETPYHWRDRAMQGLDYVSGELKGMTISPADPIRLRFVPEPAVQYDDGYQSCFPLVLEWDSITPKLVELELEEDFSRRFLSVQAIYPNNWPDRGIRWLDNQVEKP